MSTTPSERRPRPEVVVSYHMDADGTSEWLRARLHELAHSAIAELERAGAQIRLVDAGRCQEDPQSLVSASDGVVVLGGADLDPATYGQVPATDTLFGVDAHADAFELALASASLEQAVPFLGICRGMQVLNIAAAGTLIQDLGSGIHESQGPGSTMTDHELRVVPGTLLGAIYPTTSLRIRSGHHQAVGRIGAGLRVSADAPDGVIEAIEAIQSWALGVQWHPEDPPADQKQHAALMAAFVEACTTAHPSSRKSKEIA
jgi:putative glutamine amidotransferase